MEPGHILTIILVISTAVGVLLATRSLKKSGQKKVEELCQHLHGIGIKASVSGQETGQAKVRHKRPWGQKPVGTIELTGRNIDSIDVIGVASQYGVNYFLDYLVRTSGFMGGLDRKKTKMIKKKTSAFRGKVIDIEWRGDVSLSRRLNFDYQLKDRLLLADIKALKGDIGIFPEPKHQYARIRTTYSLPTPELFESIDIIAKHVRSEW